MNEWLIWAKWKAWSQSRKIFLDRSTAVRRVLTSGAQWSLLSEPHDIDKLLTKKLHKLAVLLYFFYIWSPYQQTLEMFVPVSNISSPLAVSEILHTGINNRAAYIIAEVLFLPYSDDRCQFQRVFFARSTRLNAMSRWQVISWLAVCVNNHLNLLPKKVACKKCMKSKKFHNVPLCLFLILKHVSWRDFLSTSCFIQKLHRSWRE